MSSSLTPPEQNKKNWEAVLRFFALATRVVLHPDRLWMQLVTWTVVSTFVLLGIGSGIGVLSMTPPLFLVAKICFIGSAVILWLKTTHWLVASKATRVERMVLAFLIFGLSGMLLVEAVRWIADHQSAHAGAQANSTSVPPTQTGKVIDKRFRRLTADQARQLVEILRQTKNPPVIRLRVRHADMEANGFAKDLRAALTEAGWTRIVDDARYADHDTRRGLFIETRWNEYPPPGAHSLAEAFKAVGLTVNLTTSRTVHREEEIALFIGGIEE